MLTGGCFCGRVRYETDAAPFQETSCHCASHGGSPVRFRSSSTGTRSFRPECGTQLTFELDGSGDEIDVTTCSLDEPHRVPPRDHSHAAGKLEWVKLADGLPQFRGSRGEG